MAAIKVSNYQNIADYYTTAQKQLVGISDYYYQAAVEIVMLQTFDPEIDLLEPFYRAYISAQAAYATAPTAVVSAVGTLQRHVLARATTNAGVAFTNINQWIDAGSTNTYIDALVGRADDVDTSFLVQSEFAALSDQAGFEIDPLNINP